MMKQIMKRAWEIYRTLIGDRAAKLSMALRQAWAETKAKETRCEAGWNVKALEDLGASRWTKYGKDRLYLSGCGDTIMGLEVGYYKSGNISYASLDGEHISNSTAAKIQRIYGSAYIDMTSGKLCGTIENNGYEEFIEKLSQYKVS